MRELQSITSEKMLVLGTNKRYNIDIRTRAKAQTKGGKKMKVETYSINEGTASQYYGLKTMDGQVLFSAPNNWKTEKGAIKWAERHGFEVER